jgi:uncharacterized protein (TIGR02117 family)
LITTTLKILKKILRIIYRTFAGFIAFIGAYLLLTFVSSIIAITKEPGSSNNVAIYILTNGDHTDIVVPVKNQVVDWSNEIKFQHTVSHDSTAKYVAIGWGNKGFYLNTPTWSQLKFSVAFKAAFGLSCAAIHTTFYKNIAEDTDCRKIMISNQQYARLIGYINKSFKRDAGGNIINIKTRANYNDEDAFYEANGRYNLFYTCNTWANNALKACGQKACLWTPFDKGIFYHYRK